MTQPTTSDVEGLIERFRAASVPAFWVKRPSRTARTEEDAALFAEAASALQASERARLKAEGERDEALADRDDFKERLHDLVMVDAEAWATGGGPGFEERKEKAWTRAREPFEP